MAEDARQLVEALFAAMESGDLATVGTLLDDDIHFTSGGTGPLSGTATSKTEVFEKMGKIAHLSGGTARLELVACHAVGPELALVHARRHASAAGEMIAGDVAMAVRAEGGKIVEVSDVFENRLADFWARAVAAP